MLENNALEEHAVPDYRTASDNRMPVDYRTTALRRTWAELPSLLQDRLSVHAGGRIVSVRLAGGGFTPGFAAVLEGETGTRIFAKAAPASDDFIHAQYLREIQVVPLMPPEMPRPRLLAAEEVSAEGGRWDLLVYEAVDGTMPGDPWTDNELQAVEASCVEAVSRMMDFPREYSGDPVGADMAELPSQFRPVAEGGPAPWFLPSLTAEEAAAFQASLDRCPEALAGDAVLHGDLRPDNILLQAGRAFFCDWNFLGTGAQWIDWVSVLPYARAGGLDADAWLHRSELTRDVPPPYIDAFLAGLLNYMIYWGSQPEVSSSPQLRIHGRHTAALVYAWAASRRETAHRPGV